MKKLIRNPWKSSVIDEEESHWWREDFPWIRWKSELWWPYNPPFSQWILLEEWCKCWFLLMFDPIRRFFSLFERKISNNFRSFLIIFLKKWKKWMKMMGEWGSLPLWTKLCRSLLIVSAISSPFDCKILSLSVKPYSSLHWKSDSTKLFTISVPILETRTQT